MRGSEIEGKGGREEKEGKKKKEEGKKWRGKELERNLTMHKLGCVPVPLPPSTPPSGNLSTSVMPYSNWLKAMPAWIDGKKGTRVELAEPVCSADQLGTGGGLEMTQFWLNSAGSCAQSMFLFCDRPGRNEHFCARYFQAWWWWGLQQSFTISCA